MEESALRKERLKAMRMEASQEAETYNDGSEHSTVVSHGLSNPLLESAPNPEGQVESFAQSFNYYTDPMAAFSANKRRSKVSPQISQDFSSPPPRSWTNETLPSPALQPRINHSPDQRMHQPHGQHVNPNYAYPYNVPQGGNFPNPSFEGGYPGPGRVGYPSPCPLFSNSPSHGSSQGSYPSPNTRFSSSPNHGRGGYPSPSPHFSPGHGSGQGYPSPSPHFRSSPGHGSGQGSYPNPNPHFRTGPGHSSGPSSGSQFGNSPSHGSGQGGYPSFGPNQGRGHWFGHNTSAGPSGRGRWSGQGGRGRGRGGHNHVSAEDRPDLFYNKSMVEDPWKFLEPVIWKSHKKSWLPNSLGVKKARVFESPRQQQSSSQPSLAEILAASFNEAASGEP